jgi:GNAT superfamily N-acetyltransferase
MFDLQSECEFIPLSPNGLLLGFDCGDEDLNEFFNVDAIKYQEQMLGSTYFFRHTETGKIVCAFSLSPDGLNTANLPNSRRKKVKENVPSEKPMKSYPAYLIGRLGVAYEFGSLGVGTQLLNFIKYFCFDNYRYNCRFLLVDAYNKPDVLRFYQKNNFLTVFSTEERERGYKKISPDEPLRTRYMFFDMINWKNKLDAML